MPKPPKPSKDPNEGKPYSNSAVNSVLHPSSASDPYYKRTINNQAYLNKSDTADQRRWENKAVNTVDQKINTLNGLIRKVGVNHPRYNEFVAAKARMVAGRDKLVSKVNVSTKDVKKYPEAAQKYKKYDQVRFENWRKDHPKNFYDKNTFYLGKEEQVASNKQVAKDAYNSRKSILSSPENRLYFKQKALAMKKGK